MLREYRTRALGLPDLLNFAALVDEGVVLNKDGALLAGWWYSGPDMDAASHEELAILSSHVNAALVRLGNGWMLQADAVRRPAGGYAPLGAFPDPTTALIDDERRRQYVAGRSTYESVYALTVTYLPPRDVQARLGGWFVEGETQDRAGYDVVLRFFQRRIAELEDALSDRLSVSRMGSEDLLSFLHLCVTGISQHVSVPAAPMYLDALLGSQELLGGFRPRVGDRHIRPIAVVGFPAESFPGTLDFLNRLPVDYRWSNRFIPLDPNTAEERLKLLRRNWFQKRQGLSGHDQAGAEPRGSHLRQPRRRRDGRGCRRRSRGGDLRDRPLRLLHERHSASRRGPRGARSRVATGLPKPPAPRLRRSRRGRECARGLSRLDPGARVSQRPPPADPHAQLRGSDSHDERVAGARREPVPVLPAGQPRAPLREYLRLDTVSAQPPRRGRRPHARPRPDRLGQVHADRSPDGAVLPLPGRPGLRLRQGLQQLRPDRGRRRRPLRHREQRRGGALLLPARRESIGRTSGSGPPAGSRRCSDSRA